MLIIIAAISNNGVIGKNNSLPWHLPEDLRKFKRETVGNTVVMGRKTWESLPTKPLPGRQNIVVTRNPCYHAAGAEVVPSIEAAVNISEHEKVFIIGGSELYAHAIELADVLSITEIHASVDGDTFFPRIDTSVWSEAMREDQDLLSFVTYVRKNDV